MSEYLKLPKEAVKQRVNKPLNHRISVEVETVFGIGFDTFWVFLMRQVTSSVQRSERQCTAFIDVQVFLWKRGLPIKLELDSLENICSLGLCVA